MAANDKLHVTVVDGGKALMWHGPDDVLDELVDLLDTKLTRVDDAVPRRLKPRRTRKTRRGRKA